MPPTSTNARWPPRAGASAPRARLSTGDTQASLPVERRGPLIARPGQEDLGQHLLPLGPLASGRPRRQDAVGQVQHSRNSRPERLLERADGDEPAVGAFVDLVVRGAGVGAGCARVAAATGPGPASRTSWPVASAAPSTMAASTTWPSPVRPAGRAPRDAEGQQHAAAAHVADEVQRGQRALAGAAEVVQRAGHRDVVDVVAGVVRQRTVLAPARHAAVDQPRVAGQASSGRAPSRSVTPGR